MLGAVSNTMGFFSRLFGGDKREPALSPEEVETLRETASRLAAPAVHFVPSAGEAPCYFGGKPMLPPGTPWPVSKRVGPLAFLASIDLQSVAGVLVFDWLPQTGRLLFFYDFFAGAWGFDPRDRDCWSVVYAEGGDAPRTPPPGKVPIRFVVPKRIGSLPPYERPEVESLALTEPQREWLIDAAGIALYGDAPRHQMGGYPQPIQGDGMELECQLASNGIYVGDPSGYKDPRAPALEAGAADWRLLLQIDSDDDLGMHWGDAGTIYFWIREEDARARRFERVWMVLQCH
jgi:hypothetical protein